MLLSASKCVHVLVCCRRPEPAADERQPKPVRFVYAPLYQPPVDKQQQFGVPVGVDFFSCVAFTMRCAFAHDTCRALFALPGAFACSHHLLPYTASPPRGHWWGSATRDGSFILLPYAPVLRLRRSIASSTISNSTMSHPHRVQQFHTGTARFPWLQIHYLRQCAGIGPVGKISSNVAHCSHSVPQSTICSLPHTVLVLLCTSIHVHTHNTDLITCFHRLAALQRTGRVCKKAFFLLLLLHTPNNPPGAPQIHMPEVELHHRMEPPVHVKANPRSRNFKPARKTQHSILSDRSMEVLALGNVRERARAGVGQSRVGWLAATTVRHRIKTP